MATHLNFEEQEQVDQLRHLWKTYGTPITALVLLALLAYAGWTGYGYWQNRQSTRAALINEQVQTAAQAKDWAALERALGDVRQQYAGTDYAQQASLTAAKAFHDAGKPEQARQALEWLAQSGRNEGYKAVARLRLASLALEAKDYAGALKQLEGDWPTAFQALAADKRGDVLLAQGQREAARAAYEAAYKGLPADDGYRHLVEVKLNALGVDVTGLDIQAS
ncbi:MAG: tetratricopeptide repeat protein [Comamonas sp.]